MRIISRGNSPVHAHQSAKFKRSVGALSTDAERLTIESAICHLQLLETCQSDPLRRDSTNELVWFAAPIVLTVPVATDIENLK